MSCNLSYCDRCVLFEINVEQSENYWIFNYRWKLPLGVGWGSVVGTKLYIFNCGSIIFNCGFKFTFTCINCGSISEEKKSSQHCKLYSITFSDPEDPQHSD